MAASNCFVAARVMNEAEAGRDQPLARHHYVRVWWMNRQMRIYN